MSFEGGLKCYFSFAHPPNDVISSQEAQLSSAKLSSTFTLIHDSTPLPHLFDFIPWHNPTIALKSPFVESGELWRISL